MRVVCPGGEHPLAKLGVLGDAKYGNIRPNLETNRRKSRKKSKCASYRYSFYSFL